MSRYILTKDDDGHDFIIPAENTAEWYQWLQDSASYWDIMPPGLEPPPQPGWAREIGCHLSLVTFTDPLINGEPL